MKKKSQMLQISFLKLALFSFFSALQPEALGANQTLRFTLSSATVRPYLFSYQDSQTFGDGLLVDAVKLVFSKMNYEVKLERLPFTRYLQELKSGHLQLTTCNPGLKRDYLNHYHHSPILLKSELGIWTKKDNPIDDPKDIRGETIYFATEDLRTFNFLKENGNRIHKVPLSYNIIWKSFQNGKLRFFIGTKESVLQTIEDQDVYLKDKLKFLPVYSHEFALCIGKELDPDGQLLNQFVKQVESILETPEFKSLTKKYKASGFLQELVEPTSRTTEEK